jgi:hypothetical protein
VSHSPRALSCVVHPVLKNTQPSLGGKYGRMFPGLLRCEVDLERARAGGEHLGPVGGRIVAEVLLGLLEADPGSYMNAEPGWRPTMPSAEPGEFGMADLVVFAGTAGASR